MAKQDVSEAIEAAVRSAGIEANPKAKPHGLPMQKYVLKEGMGTHTIHRGPGELDVIKSGEVVELTAGQAKAFKDKFEPLSAVVARSEIAKRQAELDDEAAEEAAQEKAAEQKRLKEEGQKALAKERAKLAEEAEDDDQEGDDDAETGDNLSSSAQDAETKAPAAQVKTVGLKKTATAAKK